MAKEASLEENRLVSPLNSFRDNVSDSRVNLNTSSLANVDSQNSDATLKKEDSSSIQLLNSLKDLIYQANIEQSSDHILKDIGNIMRDLEKRNQNTKAQNSENLNEDNIPIFPLKSNNNLDNIDIVSSDRSNTTKNNDIELLVHHESVKNIDFSEEDVKEITDSTVPYIATLYPLIRNTLIDATSQNIARIQKKVETEIHAENIVEETNISRNTPNLKTESESEYTDFSSEESNFKDNASNAYSNNSQNQFKENNIIQNKTEDTNIEKDIISNGSNKSNSNLEKVESSKDKKENETNAMNAMNDQPTNKEQTNVLDESQNEHTQDSSKLSNENALEENQKKPQQLFDIMEDTQRLIHQMRDEIKSDIASFNSESSSDENDSEDYDTSESSAVPASSIHEPRSQNDEYFSESDSEVTNDQSDDEIIEEEEIEDEEFGTEEEEVVEDEDLPADESSSESIIQEDEKLNEKVEKENLKNNSKTNSIDINNENESETNYALIKDDSQIILSNNANPSSDETKINVNIDKMKNNENNLQIQTSSASDSIINQCETVKVNQKQTQEEKSSEKITMPITPQIDTTPINDEIAETVVTVTLNKKPKLSVIDNGNTTQKNANSVISESVDKNKEIIESKNITNEEKFSPLAGNSEIVNVTIKSNQEKVSEKSNENASSSNAINTDQIHIIIPEKQQTTQEQPLKLKNDADSNNQNHKGIEISPKNEKDNIHLEVNVSENNISQAINTDKVKNESDNNIPNSNKKTTKPFVSQIPKLDKQSNNKVAPAKNNPKSPVNKKPETQLVKPVIPFSSFQNGNVKKLQQGLFNKVNITINKTPEKPAPKIPVPINSKRNIDLNSSKTSNVSKMENSKITPETNPIIPIQSAKQKETKKEGVLKPYFVETCLSDDYFTETDEEGKKQLPKPFKKPAQIIKKEAPKQETVSSQKNIAENKIDYSTINFKEGSPEVSHHV